MRRSGVRFPFLAQGNVTFCLSADMGFHAEGESNRRRGSKGPSNRMLRERRRLPGCWRHDADSKKGDSPVLAPKKWTIVPSPLYGERVAEGRVRGLFKKIKIINRFFVSLLSPSPQPSPHKGERGQRRTRRRQQEARFPGVGSQEMDHRSLSPLWGEGGRRPGEGFV